MASPRFLSVCIPTYEMGGLGHIFFEQSLEILTRQTYKDFDVVVSDLSKNTLIKEICEKYRTSLDIKYFFNDHLTGGLAINTNNAIKHATGKILKLLFQDDFLYQPTSLQAIIDNFDLEKDTWLVTGCEHSTDGKTYYRPHYPAYNDQIYLGNNTIGSPSVLTIKNDHPLLFDTNLKWLVDCDYYRRCQGLFGDPKISNEIVVVIRVGEHQITNTEATETLKKKEYQYMVGKFGKNKSKKLQLKRVTVVAVTGLDPTGAIKALEYSISGIDFYEAVLIAHTRPVGLNPKITFKQCESTDLQSQDRKNTNDYSKFMAYRLGQFIDSDFALIVHNDAYVLRPKKWDDAFLKYDYIGAPWPTRAHFTNEGVNVRIGNGGFSLRSKKLLNVLKDLELPFTDNGTGFFHEDGVICVYYRKQLEQAGIRFAPVDLASKFSHEVDCPDSDPEPFGFHNTKSVIPKYFFVKHWLRNFC